MVVSCASSNNGEQQTTYSNLVELQAPGDQPHQPSKVYVDSLEQSTRNSETVLVIHGTFPDGCTNLQEVTHKIQNDSLHLEISAWRNPKMMCTQVLTPFTFIYNKLSQKELSSHSEVVINNSTFSY